MGVVVRWLLPVAVFAAVTGSATGAEPLPLHGVPLTGHTGLQLLVANDPPLLVDVDSGRSRPITGLELRGQPVLSVLPVGKDAVVWLARRTRGPLRAEIYVVRQGTAKATRLATAWDVAPSADGRAVWLKSFVNGSHCTLRELGLDGQVRRGARPLPCSTRLVDTGSGGLLVQGSSVVDPATDRILLRGGGIRALANGFALTGDSKSGLAITDLRTGARRRLISPSRVGGPTSQGGVDQAAVAPGGRLIAVSFSDPAWQGGGTQVTDVWLLNPSTRRFQHLPGMPAAVALKATSMSWAGGGRLVMLAQTAQHDVVAVWQPGQRKLNVRRVQLPERNSGSDTFVVWPAG